MQSRQAVESFRALVYQIVSQVPAGRVTTYGQLATMIPAPAGVAPPEYRRVRAQWVGRAMRQAPDTTPWHRVINSQGTISLPPGSRPAAIQRLRLEAEGIVFDRNGRVNLHQFGWGGPAAEWLEAHGLLAPAPLSRPDAVQLGLFDANA